MESGDWLAQLGVAVVRGAAALTAAVLVGFILPAFQNPIVLAVVFGTATMSPWWWPTLAPRREFAGIAGVLLLLLLIAVFLISPTWHQ
jgi:hypothetical protein